MSKLTAEESLNLNKLIRENEDFVDNTEHIRKVKHSVKIRDDIQIIQDLKRTTQDSGMMPIEFLSLCQTSAPFLHFHYTDIFNKVVKDEINLDIMYKFLLVLKLIEDGQLNQEEGSVAVGKLLKEMYVDSALRRSENLDKQYAGEREEVVAAGPARQVSWKQWSQKKKEIMDALYIVPNK